MITIHRESMNITPRQLEILTVLSSRESWSIGQIASVLGVSPAAATKAVARLERKGLVKRQANAMDRRIVDVTLTSKAANAMR